MLYEVITSCRARRKAASARGRSANADQSALCAWMYASQVSPSVNRAGASACFARDRPASKSSQVPLSYNFV